MKISNTQHAPAPARVNVSSGSSPAPAAQAKAAPKFGYSSVSSFTPATAVRQVARSGNPISSTLEAARELINKTPADLVGMKKDSQNPIVERFYSDANTVALGHCASFASSFLQAAGMQNFFTGTITGAPNLYYRLAEEAGREGSPWTAHNPFPADMLPGADGKLTDEQAAWWNENMEVGSPVFFETGDGNDQGHVVIFTGIVDGEPMFIGANSQQSEDGVMDGPQVINEVSYQDLVDWMSTDEHPSSITSAFSYSETSATG
jgi:hypothetical protein